MTNTITISDLKACINDMPAAFMAVSSLLSPRLPNAINDDNNMAKGKAWGTSIKLMYQKNWASTSIDHPFPINSSTYLQRNCIIKMN